MASRMIALALGIGCVAWMPSLPTWSTLLGIVLVTALAILPFYKRLPVLVWLLLCLLAGVIYGTLHGYQLLQRQLPSTLEGKNLRVVGRIVSLPDYSPHRGGTYRFDFVADSWPSQSASDGGENHAAVFSKKLRLSYSPSRDSDVEGRGVALPAYGQQWEFLVRLKRPRSFANPGGFDYAAWLVAQRIDATGYVREATLMHSHRSLMSLRAQWVTALRDKLLPYSQKGVLLALAAGDRSLLSDRDWELFRLSGTSHLMAISGLHIGIAAGLGWMFGRVALSLASVWLPSWLSPTLALALGGVYAWMAGFSLPTQRAFIMVAVFVLAVALSRQLGRWQAWSIALLLVLLLNPLATLQAGFWLSFAAVAVLLAVVERGRGWRSLLRAQWVLLLGLSPFTLVFFQQASLLAFPVNLVAVPLFSVVIVPLVLLALLLEVLAGALAAPVWVLVDSVLTLFMKGLDELSRHGQFLLLDYHPTAPELLALAVFACLLATPRVFPVRYLALLCLLPLFGNDEKQLASGDYTVKVLDVGQGLSVLVQTRHHSLVYDVGPSYSERFNMVDAALLPVLRYSKVDYLDRLIISHRDNDHAGAYPRLLEEVPVGDFLAGADLTGASPCMAGQRWNWDGVEFVMLNPVRVGQGDNNDSCVLFIQSGAARTLIPGDIESGVEQRLLSSLPRDVSLLLAPHHGSKTSSSAEFVSRLAPQWVIFSAGYKHHYGHPAPTVQARYRQRGSAIAETAQSGMITAEFGPTGLKRVRHFRDQHRFYWNHSGE